MEDFLFMDIKSVSGGFYGVNESQMIVPPFFCVGITTNSWYSCLTNKRRLPGIARQPSMKLSKEIPDNFLLVQLIGRLDFYMIDSCL